MNVHGVAEEGSGFAGVHGGEDAVDGFVSADAEDGGAEDLFGFGVGEDFHEAAGFALFDGAVHLGHGADAHERGAAALANFAFAHSDVGERRIGIEGPGGDAIGDAARLAIEEVGGGDLVIVIRGVGEGAVAIAIAQGPDVLHRGAELIVDFDEAVGIDLDAGLFGVERIRIRHAADGEEHVRAGLFLRPLFAAYAYHRPAIAPIETDALGAGAEADAFGFERFAHALGGVVVFAAQDARLALNDGDFRSEAAEHLREFEADETSADDNEMLGKLFEFEDGLIGEEGDAIDAGEIRNARARADIQEDVAGREDAFAHTDAIGGFERRGAADEGATFHGGDPLFATRTRIGDDGVFAGLDAFEIDTNGGRGIETVLSAAARRVCGVGAGDHGFGGRAAGVDARAADVFLFDESDGPTGLG